MDAVIYAGSHRRGGNSDRAAELLAEGVRSAGGQADILFIRDYEIGHCKACGFCDTATDCQGQKRCALGQKDQAWELFEPMFTARAVFFTSPIYFYHLPSMFKTWVDRSQFLWTARRTNEPWTDLPERTAHTVLVAGRPRGEKLFEGARTSLKYFAANFNLKLAEPLVFRGVDTPGDLEGHADFTASITALGRQAWSEAAQR